MDNPQADNENEDTLALFQMVAPERKEQLQELWDRYTPSFCKGTDKTDFVFQANPMGFVVYTNRSILQVWLLSWVMWKELDCWSDYIEFFCKNGKAFIPSALNVIPDQKQCYADADDLFARAQLFVNSETVDWNLWPKSIPKPRDIVSIVEDIAVRDLLHFAIAFFLLHEFRHLCLHVDNERPSSALDEEFECDRWAAQYLLGCSDDYADWNGVDRIQVKSKRAMGVALGTAVMAHVQTLNLWKAGVDHPPLVDRMKRLADIVDLSGHNNFWNVASSFLLASLRRGDALPDRIEFRDYKDLFLQLLHPQAQP